MRRTVSFWLKGKPQEKIQSLLPTGWRLGLENISITVIGMVQHRLKDPSSRINKPVVHLQWSEDEKQNSDRRQSCNEYANA